MSAPLDEDFDLAQDDVLGHTVFALHLHCSRLLLLGLQVFDFLDVINETVRFPNNDIEIVPGGRLRLSDKCERD